MDDPKAGPWQSNAWIKKLHVAVCQLAGLLKPGQKLFAKMWASIWKPRGWRTEDATGAEAQKTFIKSMPKNRVTLHKGGMVRMSQWFGWVWRMAELIPYGWPLCIYMVYLNMMTGDLRREWEIFDETIEGQTEDQKTEAEQTATVADNAGAAAAAAPAAQVPVAPQVPRKNQPKKKKRIRLCGDEEALQKYVDVCAAALG